MSLNIFDIIIIILLALGALKGYRKGFIGSLVGLVGSIVAFILTIKFYQQVAQFLNEKFSILATVHKFLIKNLPLPMEVSSLPLSQGGMEMLATSIQKMLLPQFLKEQIIIKAWDLSLTVLGLGITSIGELLNYLVAITLINGLVFLIMWFLIDRLIWIIGSLLSRGLDDTLLGGINQFGGLFIGIGLNVLGLMVAIGMLSLFLEVTGQAQTGILGGLAKTVNKSVLVPYFKLGYGFVFSKVITFI